MNEEIYTNYPRFWFSKSPGPDGEKSGQFSKTLTFGQLESRGFRRVEVGEYYEVWEKRDPPVTLEQIGRAYVNYRIENPWATKGQNGVRDVAERYMAQQGLL